LSKKPYFVRIKIILICSFVLLGSLVGAPIAASPNQSHNHSVILAPSGATFDYIVTILMENNGYCEVITTCGGGGPYQTSLAATYGLAGTCQNDSSCSTGGYTAVDHPSEGNYVQLIAGDDYGFTSDCGYCPGRTSALNIIDRIEASGRTWDAWYEGGSGSGTCSANPPRGGDHYAFITFTDIQTNPARCSHLLSTTASTDTQFLAELNSATPANYIWLTPNDSNNCHDTAMSFCDNYLKTLVPKILSSTLFTTKKAALWIQYDEGNGSFPHDFVYGSWSGPVVKTGYVGTGSYSHYSYLKTLEAVWGMSSLTSNDANAIPMTEFFGAVTPPTLSATFTISPSTPLVNSPVTFTATTTGGTPPYSLSWNFGDGGSGTGASVTHTYVSPGSFTVTETATDSASPSQTSTSSQTVPVVTSLPLSTSFTFLPASPMVNSPVSFTAVTTGGTPPYTVSWNFGDGATATGATATHTYTAAQSFTVVETATDASSPTQTASATHTVVVSSSLTGNFDNTWYINNCPGGTETISNGVLQTRQSTPGGGPNSYGYCTAQRGSFPWGSTVGTALPSGITSVTVSFNFLSRNLLSGSRYHLYVALYYQIPSSTSGGTTYSWLDTQSRVENINGIDSSIGSTATYDPGDSFGWDIVTLQINPGQSGILTADVTQLCQGDLAAWGLPANTQCTLKGIEIGTEGYLVNSVNVDWYTVNLNVGPIPLSTSFTFLPATPLVNLPVTFTSVTTGGALPYTLSWNFGDGTTGTGATATHAYTTAGSFTVTETATDSSTPTKTATSTHSVTVYTSLPLSTTFSVSSTSPQVGQAVTFSASATGGTTPYIYTVAFGDGGTGSGKSVTHVYSAAGSYTATATVTDSASPQASVSRTITVNVQGLLPPILTVPSNQTVPAGTWINFTITGTPANTGGSVTLSATGLPTGATFNPTTGLFSWKPSSSQTGSYTVTFIATDDSSPSTPTSKPMGIQVNQAAPGGSNGGSGGSGGGSNGSCTLCGIIPKLSSTIGLLFVGGLLGLVGALAVLTIRARASLERTKRRMGV
jgi:PKD repeat protein